MSASDCGATGFSGLVLAHRCVGMFSGLSGGHGHFRVSCGVRGEVVKAAGPLVGGAVSPPD